MPLLVPVPLEAELAVLEVENCGAGIFMAPLDEPPELEPKPPPPDVFVPVLVEKPFPTGAPVFGTATLNGLEGAFANFGICGFGVDVEGFKTGL